VHDSKAAGGMDRCRLCAGSANNSQKNPVPLDGHVDRLGGGLLTTAVRRSTHRSAELNRKSSAQERQRKQGLYHRCHPFLSREVLLRVESVSRPATLPRMFKLRASRAPRSGARLRLARELMFLVPRASDPIESRRRPARV